MRTRHLLQLPAAALVTAAALTSCTTSDDTPAPDAAASPDTSSPRTAARVDEVATGLDAPWSIAFHGHTALLSERDSGRILELTNDTSPRQVGVIDDVTPMGEGGLLGLAVDDDDFLYAYFTAGDETASNATS